MPAAGLCHIAADRQSIRGAPVFLAMTADCTPDLRKALATRVALNAFVLLFCSVFVCTYVLEFFGLSVPIVQVAGGLVGLRARLGPVASGDDDARPAPPAGPDEPDIATRAFYPLTLPLTVGPGTISVAITLGANHSHSMRSLLANGTSELIGVTLIAVTILICYRYADRMLRALGATGTSVLVRLSAFILLCIGVQILWNGASALGESLLLARTR